MHHDGNEGQTETDCQPPAVSILLLAPRHCYPLSRFNASMTLPPHRLPEG
jgi:hypothetical protein